MPTLLLGSRRVIKTGNSHTIAIPHVWVKHHHLDEGRSEVVCEMQDDGSLMIRPKKED